MARLLWHTVPGALLLSILLIALTRSSSPKAAPVDVLPVERAEPAEPEVLIAASPEPALTPERQLAVGEVMPPAVLDIACEQGNLAKCNDIGRLYAEQWEFEVNREHAIDMYTQTCGRASLQGCRELRLLAARYVTTDPAAASRLLLRVCDIGDPEGCEAAYALAIDAVAHGQDIDRNVREAHRYLVMLCHAKYPEPVGLCDKRRADFVRLLKRKGSGIDPAGAKSVLTDMEDEERSGRYLTPALARLEWADDR